MFTEPRAYVAPDEPPIVVRFIEPPPGSPGGLAAAQTPPPPPPPIRTTEAPRRPAPETNKQPETAATESNEAQPDARSTAANGGGEGEHGGDGVEGGGGSGVIAYGVAGGTGEEPVALDQLALPPLVIVRVMPEYPWNARLEGIEGEVVLEAVIDEHGEVVRDKVVVVRALEQLDDAAIDALKRWKFRPARDRNGRAVKALVRVPLRFVLR
jgi:protein TonB